MDIITMTSLAEDPERYVYEKIIPVNLFFAIVIIFQNSLVIYDYFPERKKLITSLFILIAVADLTIALGEVLRCGLSLACINDDHTPVPKWIIITFSYVGQFGWVCTNYFNLLLTLLRTVTLSRPFDRVNNRAVVFSVAIGAAFWFIVIVSNSIDFYLVYLPHMPNTAGCRCGFKIAVSLWQST